MHWSDIRFDPSRTTLRQFAGLWLAFFGGLALWQALVGRHAGAAATLAALAVAIGPLGLIRPRLIRPVYVAWMVLAFPIGWAVSRAILAAIFYGVFTPVALVFRLTGRDALQRRRDPRRSTYWEPKATPSEPSRYLQQF